MELLYTISPNELKNQTRLTSEVEGSKPISVAYVDRYTYSWDTLIHSGIEYTLSNNVVNHNIQIGSFCSIGRNLRFFIGRSHNTKDISTGAVQLLASSLGQNVPANRSFNQKSSVIIQNDVWIGDDVTILPNVIIHNGACIAKNSHVVSDVPPYAIVGGNPARVIGYRYPAEQIDQLLNLQWWYWDLDKITDNFINFGNDPTVFYEKNKVYALAPSMYSMRNASQNNQFFFVADIYENYPCYGNVISQFIEYISTNPNCKLVIFVQEEYISKDINAIEATKELISVINDITNSPYINGSISIQVGSKELGSQLLANSSAYITARTYDTVYYSCVADLLNITLIPGTDSRICFDKHFHNMIKN